MSKGSHLQHFILDPRTQDDMEINRHFLDGVGGKTVKEHNRRVRKLWKLARMGFKFAFDDAASGKPYFVDKPDNLTFPSQFWFQLDGCESYKCYKTVYNAIRCAENLVTAVHKHSYRFRDEVVSWAETYQH